MAHESVCPFPMTRLKLHEYYAHWSDRITHHRGIPAELLIREQTSDREFSGYLDYLFKAVGPGKALYRRHCRRHPGHGRFRPPAPAARPYCPKRPAAAGRRDPAVHLRPGAIPGGGATGHGCRRPGAFQTVRKAIFRGDGAEIEKSISALLNQGIPASDILQQGMIDAMQAVGDKFSAGEVYIPEMLLAARAMEQGVVFLKPRLLAETAAGRSEGTVVIGSVFGDMHDIGKNLVAMMLRGMGYEVIDLGTNVATAEFIRQARDHKARIVALSALLTTTMRPCNR